MTTTRRGRLPGADILFGGPATRTAPAPTRPETKYTLLLDSTAIGNLLADEAELTRRLGKTPTRAALLRTLLALLHEDDQLLAKVADRIEGSHP